ncbi:MAG: hypothetical protein OEM52_03220 [bacterium]|nr:hypothetical protein [bacterium]
MKGRERLLWLLIIVVLLGLIGYSGYNTYKMNQRISRLRAENEILKVVGTDANLQKKVEKLESDLRARMALVYKQGERDPLDLIQVVRTRQFLQKLGIKETLEDNNKMRLCATLVGDDGVRSAIIKLGGRSTIVRPGDQFNGYNVGSITERQMVLERGGAKITLVNQLSPETIIEQEMLYRAEVRNTNF